jgi:hypothetical protein
MERGTDGLPAFRRLETPGAIGILLLRFADHTSTERKQVTHAHLLRVWPNESPKPTLLYGLARDIDCPYVKAVARAKYSQ